MQFSLHFPPWLTAQIWSILHIFSRSLRNAENSQRLFMPMQCLFFIFLNASQRTCLLCPLITNRNPIAITINCHILFYICTYFPWLLHTDTHTHAHTLHSIHPQTSDLELSVWCIKILLRLLNLWHCTTVALSTSREGTVPRKWRQNWQFLCQQSI